MRTRDITRFRNRLLAEVSEGAMCNECGGAMYEGMCTECGYMEEELKGDQHKIDADKDGEITSKDFKMLRAKNLKEQGELELGIKYDLNGETGYIQTGGSNNPRDWKFKGKYEYLAVKDELVPLEQQPGKYDGAFGMGGGKGHHIDENEDHEVSMANNSLDAIIWAANELKRKLGDEERDIPAWIQDHITNAENFILQAAKNFHEYGDSEEEDYEDFEDDYYDFEDDEWCDDCERGDDYAEYDEESLMESKKRIRRK